MKIRMLFTALVLAALTLAGCSAATMSKVVTVADTTENVLDKVANSIDILDGAFAAYCVFQPSKCTTDVRAQYQVIKATATNAILAFRDTAGALASGGDMADIKKAYDSMVKFLCQLGATITKGTVSAPRKAGEWTPWTAPEPFAS